MKMLNAHVWIDELKLRFMHNYTHAGLWAEAETNRNRNTK